MGHIGMPELMIIMVIISAVAFGGILVVLPWWFILKRAGHPPALSLLMILPVVSFAVTLWFAFAEWPIDRELQAVRQR